jgi:hypothetical protein
MHAKKKKMANLDVTYSHLLGAATLNNTFCLSLFLGLVWVRKLEWAYSAEVTVLVTVQLVIGILTSTAKNNVIPVWKAVVAGSMFPLSLAMVYALQNVAGWD